MVLIRQLPQLLQLLQLLVLLLLPLLTPALDTATCIGPLGMESGAIKDDHISASSSFEHASVGPHNARIRVDKNGGAWCPRNMIGRDASEWIEIDLKGPHVITAIETMGRFGNGQGAEFAEAYVVEYYRSRLGRWVRYRNVENEEVMQANTNTYLAVKNALVPVILGEKVRVHPYSPHQRTICLRLEVYGCPTQGGLVSYTMPQGEKRGTTYEFYDYSYDGEWRGDSLTNGLGSLTDGDLGPADYKLSYYSKNRGWVGWKNEKRDFVEILFEFADIREFHAVQIFTNNQFTRDVAVFKELRAFFSIGGRIFSGEPVSFAPLADEIFEEPRNVTVKLHRRVGRFVRLQLFFASKWLLISEVEFDSSPARGNYSEEQGDEVTTIATTNSTLRHPAVLSSGKESGVVAMVPAEPSGSGGVVNAAAAPPNKSDASSELALMPIIVGALTTVIILLAGVIFFIVSRSRQRKQQQWGTKASVVESTSSGLPSVTDKMALHPGAEPLLHYSYFADTPGSESGSNSGSRSGSRKAPLVDDNYNSHVNNGSTRPMFGSPRMQRAAVCTTASSGYTGRPAGGSCRTSPALRRATPLSTPRMTGGRHTGTPRRRIISNPLAAEPPLYMEPYHAMRYSPYVRCGPTEFAVSRETAILSDTSCGEYATPLSKMPAGNGMKDSVSSSRFSGSETSLDQNSDYVFLQDMDEPSGHRVAPESAVHSMLPDSLQLLRSRLDTLVLHQVEPASLRLKERIAEGSFGTVHTAEASVPAYGQPAATAELRLVAVKYMSTAAGDTERSEFLREVRLLASLEDENISRVLAISTASVPYLMVLEYLEHGILNRFLRSHLPEDTPYLTPGTRTLSLPTLIYMAAQVASGMKYLESLNFVHRDLATRNCLLGKAYHIKICDFGSDSPEFRRDYAEMEDGLLLPVRWMAWESVIERRYTTKSDVWSFAVCLWEILNFGGVRPHHELTDAQLVARLRMRSCPHLPCPRHCPKDLYELMMECWNAVESDRPTFREIHLFLQRKNLGYSPV